jgi:uncharacterized oxidoreductase
MNLEAQGLERIAARIFEAAGSSPAEAAKVAARLVEANLTGHDSHGIIRVHQYVTAIRDGYLKPNQSATVVSETGAVVAMDGGFGFGQIVAEQAMTRGLEKARAHGVALLTLRNASHVGRLADWVLMAADQGMVALMLCNAVGVPPIVVPHGGREPRTSTNPLAVAIPVPGGAPLMLDFATAAVAEGKVRVAHHKGVATPQDCLLDAEGRPTSDPGVLYREPRGALLPFGGRVGGHKAGGLSLVCDLLAGAFSGGRCNYPVEPDRLRFANNLFVVIVDPTVYGSDFGIADEVRRYVDYARSAAPRAADGEVLIPGEPERRMRARRFEAGVPVPDATFEQLMEAAGLVGLARVELEALVRGADA